MVLGIALSGLCAADPPAEPVDDMPPPTTVEFRAWFESRVESAIAAASVTRDATRYVSSSMGDDAGPGDSPDHPWRTLERVRAWLSDPAAGTRRVRFRRGDVFRDTQGIQSAEAGVAFSDYGDPGSPRPRLTGFASVWPRVAPAADLTDDPWIVDPRFPAVGSRPMDRDVFWVRQSADGVTDLEEDLDSPMRRVSSASAVPAFPGSWHFDAITGLLTVHTRGEVPIESVTIEAATAIGPGIAVSGDLSLVENLHAEGWGMHGNSVEPFASYACGTARTVFRNLVAYYGERHLIAHMCPQEGGFALIVDCTAGRPSPTTAGQTIFNSYAQRGKSQAIFHRCTVTHDTLPDDVSTYLDVSLPVYAHTSAPIYRLGYVIVSDLRYGGGGARPIVLPMFADAPDAPTLDLPRAIIMDTTAHGLRGAHAWGANTLVMNCSISTRPAAVNCRCGQSLEADGWLVNSIYELDLTGADNGLYAFVNSNGGNEAKTLHSVLRIRHAPSGATVRWDFDGSQYSHGTIVHNSVVDVGGAAFELNVLSGPTPIRANGYVGTAAHPLDAQGVTLAPPYDPQLPVPPGSPLVGIAAVLDQPAQVEFDMTGTVRARLTAGPREFVAACPGDINGDERVGALDLVELLAAWDAAALNRFADLTGDGDVDALDLAALISNWGPCLPDP
jgi:hypothetical protein